MTDVKNMPESSTGDCRHQHARKAGKGSCSSNNPSLRGREANRRKSVNRPTMKKAATRRYRQQYISTFEFTTFTVPDSKAHLNFPPDDGQQWEQRPRAPTNNSHHLALHSNLSSQSSKDYQLRASVNWRQRCPPALQKGHITAVHPQYEQ